MKNIFGVSLTINNCLIGVAVALAVYYYITRVHNTSQEDTVKTDVAKGVSSAIVGEAVKNIVPGGPLITAAVGAVGSSVGSAIGKNLAK